jgi:hypothetical protein
MAALHEFNSNGKPSSVWTAEDAGVDTGGSKYIACCDKHGTFAPSRSVKDAIRVANSTHNFCDECRDELHEGKK